MEVPTATVAATITNQFFDRVGIVQQGDHNTAIQQVNAGPEEYAALLDQLREAASALPDAERSKLLAFEEDLREELSKKTPKLSRVAATFQAGAQIVSAVQAIAPAVFEAYHKLGAILGPLIKPFLP